MSGRGSGGFGVTTKKIDVVFTYDSKGAEKSMETTEKKLYSLTAATQKYGTVTTRADGSLKRVVATQQEAIPSMRNMTMHIQAMNMQFLGITMSLLGFTFALRQSGLVTDETMDQIMRVIGPIQMTISLINMATSVWGLYSLMKQHTAMTEAVANAQIGGSNIALGMSFGWVAMNIWRVWAAMGALSLLFAGLLTDIPALRAALWGVAAVLAVVALANMKVTLSNIWATVTAMMGAGIPLVGIMIAAGVIATAAAVTGYVTAVKGLSLGLWRGGIIDSPISLGEIGTEIAIAPLYSQRGRQFLEGSGSGGGIIIQHMTVESDRPSTFTRKMDSGLRHRKYLSAITV